LAFILFAFVCFPKHGGTSKQVCFFFKLISRIEKKITGGNLIAPTIGLFDTAWALKGSLFGFLSQFWRFFCYFQAVFASAFNDRNSTEGANRPHVIIRREALDALQR